jgi:hypothetical protein
MIRRLALALALLGLGAPALVAPSVAAAQARVPYLMRGTDTGMHVLWRSASPEISRVCYGTDVASLGSTA